MLHVLHEMAVYIKKKKNLGYVQISPSNNSILPKKQVNFLHFNKTIL